MATAFYVLVAATSCCLVAVFYLTMSRASAEAVSLAVHLTGILAFTVLAVQIARVVSQRRARTKPPQDGPAADYYDPPSEME